MPFIAPDDRQKFEQELQKVRDPEGPGAGKAGKVTVGMFSQDPPVLST